MAEVRVDVGGRTYPLACKDGEEELIRRLAGIVDEKAKALTAQLGYLPEVRLLLMSAIMIADEQGGGEVSAAPAADERVTDALAAAAERVEAIAAALEQRTASS